MRIIKPSLIGTCAYHVTQCLVKTMRPEIYLHPAVEVERQYAYGFWHGKQFSPITLLAKYGNRKHVGLVSASRDGEMLATWLKRLGYHVIRGSSSRKKISSLVKLIGAAKEGYSVAIAADGPRGPRHEAKSGLAFLAHKTSLKIIPLGVAYTNTLQFNKSWDKYQMPLPFSKVMIYFGEPISILDLKDIDAANQAVAQAINLAENQAKLILDDKQQVQAQRLVKLKYPF